VYREGRDAFSTEELNTLLMCAPGLARALDLAVVRA